MEVKIIKGPEEGRWTVRVANDSLLIEGKSYGGPVSVSQYRIIGYMSSEGNQSSLILGEKQDAERESIDFLRNEMARVKDQVPGEIRERLYDFFWKNIGLAAYQL